MNTEVIILEQVNGALVPKKIVKIWTKARHFKNVLQQSKRLQEVSTCKEADILIYDRVDTIPLGCEKKMVFVTRFRLLHSFSSAVGAFFWSKGRPQLLFVSKRLRQREIRLPSSLEQFSSVEF